ncbi:FaeA/PapI family transcriptional regulator [Natronomonas salsuginis]|uniref:Helix-turn-helix transcriptional regulator n=1 Tax=Natronomonas salsuginis TaxID=2217661 RepID=A0A4U5JB71_9EURY|nr:FaeA/PapI family transcriptional regulator [Natronomonas salsuginis]TKR25835.1 helix-turn-helix transcriptional regulator [Natronomonas salsuginis]
MTADESTGGDGRQTYSDDAFIEAVSEKQPAATKEVADLVGCTRRNADYRLRRLEDEGKVTSKEAGNSLIWSITSEP